mmetsp:Transcript_27362/g.39190  ORF Transcript_27362/g.39190 Transcript_27362/m.39190 type:complete len:86 (+) Transcript_27362:2561-2818(+)
MGHLNALVFDGNHCCCCCNTEDIINIIYPLPGVSSKQSTRSEDCSSFHHGNKFPGINNNYINSFINTKILGGWVEVLSIDWDVAY